MVSSIRVFQDGGIAVAGGVVKPVPWKRASGRGKKDAVWKTIFDFVRSSTDIKNKWGSMANADVLLKEWGYSLLYGSLSDSAKAAFDSNKLVMIEAGGKTRVGYREMNTKIEITFPMVAGFDDSNADPNVKFVEILKCGPEGTKFLYTTQGVGGFVELTSDVNNSIVQEGAYVLEGSCLKNCMVSGVSISRRGINSFLVYPKGEELKEMSIVYEMEDGKRGLSPLRNSPIDKQMRVLAEFALNKKE